MKHSTESLAALDAAATQSDAFFRLDQAVAQPLMVSLSVEEHGLYLLVGTIRDPGGVHAA
jgi:hypothetical protein